MVRTSTTHSGEDSLLRNRLLRGGAWVFVGRCGGMASQFALNLLLTRLLPLSDFGAYVFLTSIVVPVSTIAMFGFNRLAIKLLAESLSNSVREHTAGIFQLVVKWSLWSVATVTLVAAVLLYLGLPRILPSHSASWLAPLVALWIAGLAMHQLMAEVFRGFHELRFSSLLMGQNGGPITNLVLASGLAVSSLVAVSNLLSTVVLTVASFALLLPVIVYWSITTTKSHGLWDVACWKSAAEEVDGLVLRRAVLGSCGMIVVGQVLLFAVNQGDVWISNYILGPSDVAILGAARRLVLVAAVPSFLVNMTVISSIPELYASGRLAELQRMLQSAAAVAMLLSVVVFIPLLLVPGTCLSVVYTPEYQRGAGLVVILAVSNLIYCWSGASVLVLQLTGRERLAAAIQLAAAAFLFLAAPPVATRFGLNGLVGVSAITLTLLCLTSWLAVRWSVGIWTHPSISPRHVLARWLP